MPGNASVAIKNLSLTGLCISCFIIPLVRSINRVYSFAFSVIMFVCLCKFFYAPKGTLGGI